MNNKHSLDSLRIPRGTMFPACICLMISCHPLFWAQSPADNKSGANLQSTVLPLNLRYDDPKTYPVGSKQSAIIGDFQCGSDGTVFLPVLEDLTALRNQADHTGPRLDRTQHFLVTGLTPTGDVVRFVHVGIPGLRNFFPELRYFVSPSRVYTLEAAQIYDPTDPDKNLGLAHVILIYDYKGAYQGVVRLEPGLNPINIAALSSGDILVVSLDKLNQTTRLLIFDPAGRPVKELKLFDEDYALKLQLADKAGAADSVNRLNALWSHLALAHWAPFGENLLMSSNEAQLPLIEINENGIVRSTNVILPDNASVGGTFGSSDTIYHVLASATHVTQTQASVNASPAGQTFFIPTEIDDINPGDGTILKRVKFTRGLNPVCVRDENYTFLSTRGEDGRLQTIRGTVVH